MDKMSGEMVPDNRPLRLDGSQHAKEEELRLFWSTKSVRDVAS